MPEISVITGAYNAASHPFFKRSVESILNQSFGDFEFIICDDGSTDQTYDLLLSFKKTDSRIKLIRNEKNLGLAVALNKCIGISKGRYIARHDLDDYSYPLRFEKQYRYLESHPETAFLGTSIYLFDSRGIFAEEKMRSDVGKRDFLFGNPYRHGTVMFRREKLLTSGLYRTENDTVRNEDYDLFMRMSIFCKGENLTEPLYAFYEDGKTIKRRKYKYRINEAKTRLRGYRALGLMPTAVPYILKPLIVGLIPTPFLKRLRRIRRAFTNNK